MTKSKQRLVVLGGGGHGKVVAEVALAAGGCEEAAFLDDRYPDLREVLGCPVVGTLSMATGLIGAQDLPALGLGNNTLRLQWLKALRKAGVDCPTIVHPRATVSESATLGGGTVVMAGAVINASAVVESACIINTGSTVDHDCVLSDGVHVSPGANLAGGVRVGQCSWIGLGSVVKEECTIGSNVVLGAGAVLLRNTGDNETWVGVPARIRNPEA